MTAVGWRYYLWRVWLGGAARRQVATRMWRSAKAGVDYCRLDLNRMNLEGHGAYLLRWLTEEGYETTAFRDWQGYGTIDVRW